MKTNLRSMIDDALDGDIAYEGAHGYYSGHEMPNTGETYDTGVLKLAQALNYVSANLNDLGTTEEKLAELALLQEKIADAASDTTVKAGDTFGDAYTALKDQGLGKAWEGLSTGRKWVAGGTAGLVGLGALYGGYKLLSGNDGNRTTVIKNASLNSLDAARARAIVKLADAHGMSQWEYFDKVAASAAHLRFVGADDTGSFVGTGRTALPTVTGPGATGGKYTVQGRNKTLEFADEASANKYLEKLKADRAQQVSSFFPQQDKLTEPSRKALETFRGGGALSQAEQEALYNELKANPALGLAADGSAAGKIRGAAQPTNMRELDLGGGAGKVYYNPKHQIPGGKTLGSLSEAELKAAYGDASTKGRFTTTAPKGMFEQATDASADLTQRITDRGARRTTMTASADPTKFKASLNNLTENQLRAAAKNLGVDISAATNKAGLLAAFDTLSDDAKRNLLHEEQRTARGLKPLQARQDALIISAAKEQGKPAVGTSLLAKLKNPRTRVSSFSGEEKALLKQLKISPDEALSIFQGRDAAPIRKVVSQRPPKGPRQPNADSVPTQGRNSGGPRVSPTSTTKETSKELGFFGRNRRALYTAGGLGAAGLAGYGLYRAMSGGGGRSNMSNYEPPREAPSASYGGDYGGGEYKSAGLLARDELVKLLPNLKQRGMASMQRIAVPRGLLSGAMYPSDAAAVRAGRNVLKQPPALASKEKNLEKIMFPGGRVNLNGQIIKTSEDRTSPARITAGPAAPFSGFDIRSQGGGPVHIDNPVALRAQQVRAMINGSMNSYVNNTGDGYNLDRYLGRFNQ